MIFYGSKGNAAQFVEDLQSCFEVSCVSTMIISAGKSEDSFALIAIDTLSVDIVKTRARYYSLKLMNISLANIRAG